MQERLVTLSVPRLYCPNPVRVDEPLGAHVDDLLLSWVDEVGIFPDRRDAVIDSHFGRFAMLAHPDTDDPDRLLLSAQCIVSLFAVDDYYCDDERTGSDPLLIGPRLSRALAAVEPAHLVGGYRRQLALELAADPVLVGLRRYFERVAHFGTPAQLARVRHETVAMFVTMGAEGGWRLSGSIPEVWEYLAQRQVNSFLPCMSLIDIIGGYELPASVYSAPAVRRATTLAASATICANDLYSAQKEAVTQLADFNLPGLIARAEGCSLQGAVGRAAAIHDELVRSYEAVEAELLRADTDPLLRRWLAGVRAWMAGSRAWHATSGRYLVPSAGGQVSSDRLFDPEPFAGQASGVR